jgi:hypothetical protein
LRFREDSHYPKVLDSLCVIWYRTFRVRARAFSNCGSCSAVFFHSGIANSTPAVLTAIRPACGCCGHFGVRRLAAAFPSSNPHPSKASAAPAHRKKAVPLRQLCKSLSPLDATLTNCGVYVATKGLTHNLSRLDATLTKNTGGTQIPERIATNEESDHIGRGPSCI